MSFLPFKFTKQNSIGDPNPHPCFWQEKMVTTLSLVPILTARLINSLLRFIIIDCVRFIDRGED